MENKTFPVRHLTGNIFMYESEVFDISNTFDGFDFSQDIQMIFFFVGL